MAVWVTVYPAAVSAVASAAVPLGLSSAMTSTDFEQTHTELTHCPDPQVIPQPPQLLGSTRVSNSQPSAGLLLQSEKPGLQAASVHAPPAHPAMPFGGSTQAVPQALQLATSVL